MYHWRSQEEEEPVKSVHNWVALSFLMFSCGEARRQLTSTHAGMLKCGSWQEKKEISVLMCVMKSEDDF